MICELCKAKYRRSYGCTNRRCVDCHHAVCTPGGSTSPGHGLGSKVAQEKRKREVVVERTSI